jgi:hypothetical protein
MKRIAEKEKSLVEWRKKVRESEARLAAVTAQGTEMVGKKEKELNETLNEMIDFHVFMQEMNTELASVLNECEETVRRKIETTNAIIRRLEIEEGENEAP